MLVNDNLIQVHVDVDVEGNIILPALAGTSVVPDKDYDYLFEVEELDFDVFPSGYKVENGELIKR